MAEKQAGVWGIDLGQCALKAIRLEMIDGEVTATAFDYVEHPKILSQPDADPDQLIREALEKFLSRNELKGDTVAISVPGQSGLARFVKLPPVEERKIADIVRFEAKQQIPFPLEEVVWDFQKLASGNVADGFAMETEIGLFAMKRETINRYLQHFTEVKVEVHYIQMAPLALCNFISHDLLTKETGADDAAEEEDDEDRGKKSCIVALDIGADSSNLVITDGARIIWQRPIPIGGNHFTRCLTKDLKLTFAKAEHLKRNAIKSPDLKKILGALRPVLNDFVGEVQRSLGYFTNTHRDARIKYLIGLGNAFRLPGLQRFLQEKLQLEVRKLQKIRRLQGDEVITSPQFVENVLSFGVVHGLALQGLKLARLQTNLLPHEIRQERLVRAKKPWAVAVAAALLIAVSGLGFGDYMQRKAIKNENVKKALERVDNVVKRANDINSAFEDQKTKAKQSLETVERIGAGVNERFNWNQIYQYINDALPRPDGDRVAKKTSLSFPAHATYFSTQTGAQAYKRAQQRRAALVANSPTVPTPEDFKEEEDIKKNLVQVNIEGVLSFYSDDLPTEFFATLEKQKHRLPGMRTDEKAHIEKDKEKLPKKGWVVEIRGYTYHKESHQFVINTLVENLAWPEGVGIKLGPALLNQVKDKENPEKTRTERKLGYVFLYKHKQVLNPQPAGFDMIRASMLREVLGGGLLGPEGIKDSRPKLAPGKDGETQVETKPAAAVRSWSPLGEMASGSYGLGAATGHREDTGAAALPVPNPPPGSATTTPAPPTARNRQARTEFVIFFVWQEPVLSESPAAAEPPP